MNMKLCNTGSIQRLQQENQASTASPCPTCGCDRDSTPEERRIQDGAGARGGNLSPGKSASGWLERRIKSQKLLETGCMSNAKRSDNQSQQNGVIASYPRISGGRNPDNITHWYWSYCWAVFTHGRWRTKRLYVPRRKVYLAQRLIQENKPVEVVLLHLVPGGVA